MELKNNQIKRFEEIISKITEKKISIVDVGCGYGALYQYLLNMRLLDRFDYEGVDINSDFIKSCKQKYPQINFLYQINQKKLLIM